MICLWRAGCAGLGVTLLVAVACGGPQDAAEEGEDCYRAADCKPGLVCIPGSGGSRTCSRDIGGLVDQVVQPPPPPDAGVPMDDGSMPMDDGSMPMDDGSMPMDDGSMPMDDGSMPMDDAGGEPPADGG